MEEENDLFDNLLPRIDDIDESSDSDKKQTTLTTSNYLKSDDQKPSDDLYNINIMASFEQ